MLGTDGTAAIKRASTHDIMRLRGSTKAAIKTLVEVVCCGDDGDNTTYIYFVVGWPPTT